MPTIPITQFGNGRADDYTDGGVGEFAVAKHFDILSYPKRLQPLRGNTVESVVNSGVGNLLVASDGLMYGLGWTLANNAIASLWKRAGYGVSDVWAAVGGGVGTSGIFYNLFVEFPSESNGETIIFAYAGTNLIGINPSTGGSTGTKSVSFTNIGQGFIHPKDKILYIPYDNKIGTLASGAAWASFVTASAGSAGFVLPSQYIIPCLTHYGDYLAIPAYSSSSGNGINNSIVYLSNRDVTLTTFSESIPWGAGQLKVLNNLNGILIGISTASAGVSGTVQDSDSIYIKGYDGGSEPFLIKEIKATRLTNTAPSVSINQRVNFIHNNRLYFSVNIVNGGNAPAYYGLWSVGKNKNGRWTITMERMATNAGTETGVLAAAITGDFVSMAHTTVGTLTFTTNGNAGQYGATSVYESTINPEMPEGDRLKRKQLMRVKVYCLPLSDINNNNHTIIMKYRVDWRAEDSASDNSWTTIFTKTSASPTTDLTFCEMINASGVPFTAGHKYEFRLESKNGAVITDWEYEYKTLT